MPMKVAGKSGSVRVRLVPAPRGSGVVGSMGMKKMLAFAVVQDCFTCSCGHTRTKGNFMKATIDALGNTYGYLTPDLWRPTHFVKSPFQSTPISWHNRSKLIDCVHIRHSVVSRVQKK